MAYVYSSEDVEIAWTGIPFTGLAPDSFITITPTEDVMQANSGGDGLQEVSYSPDKSGTVTISLQQGSDTARLLAASVGARTVGDLTIVDPSGSIFAQCKDARIMTRAEITRGINAGDNTNDWTFWCEELIYTGTPSGVSGDVAVFASAIGSVL
jgi:hypothetical protein